MKTLKLIVLLALAAGIFGPAAYFGYELFVKPARAERAEKSAPRPAPTPTPTPETGGCELTAIKSRLSSGTVTPQQTREALQAWIENHPVSPLIAEARGLLGSINLSLILHPAPDATNSYTVVKGDSLAKIASKLRSNAELIQVANALPGISLQIGQVLVIPSPQISLELDRGAKTLTLLDKGAFVKAYTLAGCPSAPKNATPLSTKVLDKVATASGKRIAFGDRNYASSDRLILLSQASPISGWSPGKTEASADHPPGSPVPAETNPPAVPPSSPMPGGYVLASPDLLELFPLVSRNTPVTIK